MPRSLRTRLILAFGLLVFLSLFLAGIATVYLLKEEQEKTASERVGRLAEPVGWRTLFLELSGASQEVIQAQLDEIATANDVRILLIDRDATIVGDTGETLRGQTIAELQQRGLPARPLPGLRFQSVRYRQGAESLILFSSPQTGPLAALPGPQGGVLVPRYQAVVAVKESDLRQAWRELLPRLFIAGGIALAVGVVSAGLLARSIARPLRQITAASEEMALGRYDQQIPQYGGEEVGRLAQAFNAMARQVSRSHRTLREFLANVSHELKTPLTSIQGFSEAMVDGSLRSQDEFEEAGRIINDEARRMRALVDDLLYLSQVEAGEVQMQRDRLDVHDLLQATRRRFQRRAADAGIALAVEENPVPSVVGDARRLEQALANLVDNAVRYTPAGGAVTLRATAANGDVAIAVHNTGSVIPPEHLSRIFDRFYRANVAAARADGNTGLGLAITREIIEAHGGSVGVTSSEDAGTEFVVSLPAAEARPEPRARPVATRQGVEESVLPRKDGRGGAS